MIQEEPPEWDKILQAIEANEPVESTALHHAIATTASNDSSSIVRLEVIDALLQQHPEQTVIQVNGYTPLAFAVDTKNLANLDDDAKTVKSLLLTNPASIRLEAKTESGRYFLSPLSLHIVAISKLVIVAEKSPSQSVLQALLNQSKQECLEEALETLYSCNTKEIMEKYVELETLHHYTVREFGRQTRGSDITGFWVWEWAEAILRSIHKKKHAASFENNVALKNAAKPVRAMSNTAANATKPVRVVSEVPPPFHALHTAAGIKDCPVAFILFAMRAEPSQVRVSDSFGNFPLHLAATWQSRTRKSMVLTSLVAEYPKAVSMKNAAGLNPIELEAASGSIIE